MVPDCNIYFDYNIIKIYNLSMLKKQSRIQSFRCAIDGIKIAWREESNFRIEIICAVAIILLSRVLHIGRTEFAVVILTIGFVLAVEALNTSLEELCDKFEPNHDPHIGKIKDLAAAAVLASSICAAFVGSIIFSPYLF